MGRNVPIMAAFKQFSESSDSFLLPELVMSTDRTSRSFIATCVLSQPAAIVNHFGASQFHLHKV